MAIRKKSFTKNVWGDGVGKANLNHSDPNYYANALWHKPGKEPTAIKASSSPLSLKLVSS